MTTLFILLMLYKFASLKTFAAISSVVGMIELGMPFYIYIPAMTLIGLVFLIAEIHTSVELQQSKGQ